MSFSYDVCLSFAGEDRGYVEQVAEELRRHEMQVFYDRYEEAELWGKDLYQHLTDVYQNRAQYCVVFASAAYASKVWTRRELESAQARALQESREYILLARFDDTPIPGILPTIGYVDLKNKTPESLASLIVKKVRLSPRAQPDRAISAAPFTPPARAGDTLVAHSRVRGVLEPASARGAERSSPSHDTRNALRTFDMGALQSSTTGSDTTSNRSAPISSSRFTDSHKPRISSKTTLARILGVGMNRLRQRVILVGSTSIVAAGAFLAVDGYTNVTVENIVMASGIAAVALTIALPIRGFLSR